MTNDDTDSPFGGEITEPDPVAIHPDCGGGSFLDYSAELYEEGEIDGQLLWCSKCEHLWVLK